MKKVRQMLLKNRKMKKFFKKLILLRPQNREMPGVSNEKLILKLLFSAFQKICTTDEAFLIPHIKGRSPILYTVGLFVRTFSKLTQKLPKIQSFFNLVFINSLPISLYVL